jgi:hypothetical protein
MSPARPALATGQIYRDFDAFVRRAAARLAERRTEVPGCDPDAVRARLAQRVVEVAGDAFTRRSLEQGSNDLGSTVLNGLRVDTCSGRVSPSARLALHCLLQFGASWWRFLRALMREFRVSTPSADPRPATIVFGATGFEDDDARFVQFCRRGPVGVLSDAEWLVVEAARRPAILRDASVSYAPDPLARVCGALHWSGRLRVFALHLTAPFRLVAAVLRSPLVALVARDLALIGVVDWLTSRRMLANIVITTSAFAVQPLWMHGLRRRQHRLHMVWYSQNFVPKQYVGEEIGSDLPAARHMRVDEHWVWTPGFAEYLRSLEQRGSLHVVGPLLWYLPGPAPAVEGDAIRIAVFDVTPFESGASAFGAAKNYYSAETIAQFINDIVAACDRLKEVARRPVHVLVKHKRSVSSRHDRGYLRMLDELVKRRDDFTLVDHRLDLFALLTSCEVSVSVPYTSTAYVAAYLGKPALFYDPQAELMPVFEKSEHIGFCAGRAELEDALLRLTAAAGSGGVVVRS